MSKSHNENLEACPDSPLLPRCTPLLVFSSTTEITKCTNKPPLRSGVPVSVRSPVQNRTGISGSGDLRTIHCTTGPFLSQESIVNSIESYSELLTQNFRLFYQSTYTPCKHFRRNSQQNYTEKLSYRQ